VDQFRLSQNNLVELKEIRQKALNKLHDRKLVAMGLEPNLPSTSSGSKIQRKNTSLNNITNVTNDTDNVSSAKVKVDIEYLNILLLYVKHYNAACALCVCTRYFGRTIFKPTSLLLKCVLKCNGSECHFKCAVHVLNNGQC
jgi:hypothetical protein